MASMIEIHDDFNKYSADEFIKKISASDIYCKLGSEDKQTIVQGNVAFTSGNYSKKHVTLLNIVFENLVSFSSLHLRSGLVFKNCDFQRRLTFEDCNSSKDIESKSALENYTLTFLDCKISSLIVGVSTFENGISIQGSELEKSEIGKISFQDVIINASLSLSHCHLSSSFGFFGGIVKSMGIHFSSVQIDKSVRISPKVCSNLYFEGKDLIIKEFLNISGTKYDSIIFNTGTFQDEVTIQDNSISGFLSFLGSEFESEVKVSFDRSNMDPFHVKEIHVQDTKFKNGLQFSGNGVTSEKFQINFSEKSSGVIDFRNTFFKEVIFKGINFNNSVFLRDCSYDELTFSHFFNKALISLNNNNPEGQENIPKELLVENSNLGNTEFYGFDFNIYPSVRIIDSRLDSIFTYGTTWFENHKVNVGVLEGNRNKILSQRREIFRQLKLAAEKQSDRITALDFQAREVEIHAEIIKGKRVISNNSFKNWLIKNGDLASIWIGKTNGHGQNWLLPFGLLILTTIIIYPFLIISADSIISWKWDWSAEGWHLFKMKICDYDSIFWQLFNPTRRVRDLFPNPIIPASAHFWDGIQRIILAFFIFQIISAFRKFVK